MEMEVLGMDRKVRGMLGNLKMLGAEEVPLEVLEGLLDALKGKMEGLGLVDRDDEEEVFAGSVSPAIIAMFNQMDRDFDDAKTQFQRESEDMHKAMERKADELNERFQTLNNDIWKAIYAELGIDRTPNDEKDERHYRLKRKERKVVQVITKKAPEEENIIDFRKK